MLTFRHQKRKEYLYIDCYSTYLISKYVPAQYVALSEGGPRAPRYYRQSRHSLPSLSVCIMTK